MENTFARWLLLAAAVLATVAKRASCAAPCADACYCPAGATLDCMRRGVAQPPPGYWPAIGDVKLSYNAIASLYASSFTAFPNAVSLYLAANQLRDFDVAVYASMPKLKILSLVSNKINNIIAPPDGATLEVLWLLYIQDNNITTVDPDLLQRAAPALVHLYFDQNPLVIPDGQPFIRHDNVETLTLKAMKAPLAVGARTFAALPKLKELVLKDAGIASVDGAFAANAALQTLYLDGNRIQKVTAGTLSGAGVLRRLALGGCASLARVDPSAVSAAVAPGGAILIDDTPLACACDYAPLFWWATGRGVSLSANCSSKPDPCRFAR